MTVHVKSLRRYLEKCPSCLFPHSLKVNLVVLLHNYSLKASELYSKPYRIQINHKTNLIDMLLSIYMQIKAKPNLSSCQKLAGKCGSR